MEGACVNILASRWWQAAKPSGKDEAVDYNWLMEFKKTYSASKPVEQQSFISLSLEEETPKQMTWEVKVLQLRPGITGPATLKYRLEDEMIADYVAQKQKEGDTCDAQDIAVDYNTEREIRAMVMGKKAYLFCQTDDACERAAMMYSFFGACKVKGKNPERWLTYVLNHIKETKDEDMYKLLPEFWEDIN